MLVAIADVYTQIPQRDAAEQVMLRAQTAARGEDGCVAFAFAQMLGEPGHYLLVARWRDQAAFDAHYASAAFAEYQNAITPLLVRDSELRVDTVQETVLPLDSSPLDIRHDD